MGKLIVISAPSGAGKTSIVHFLIKNIATLSFSISACSREKRANEINGEDYHFLEESEFKKKIRANEFIEWEEVYENQYYGTLRKEVYKIWANGNNVIFDVDVIGGLKIKKQYPKSCLSIFIMPPSIDILKKRLENRGSESAATLEKRLNKAEAEILLNKKFDAVIINDNFEIACQETKKMVTNFIKS